MNKSLEKLLNYCAKDQKSASNIAIDVGAYVGDFSISLAKLGLFDKIYSFEANPSTYERLIALKPIANSIVPINLALGEYVGEVVLHVDEDPATASTLPYDAGYENRGEVVRRNIAMTRLDDFLAQRDELAIISMIKIDTQGSDLSVLKGARQTIAASRPIIQTEIILKPTYQDQADPRHIRGFLADLGYLEFSLGDIHVDEYGKLAFHDAIFVPQEKDTPESQNYHQLDNEASYEEQIRVLTRICEERLELINRLDSELKNQPLLTKSWLKRLQPK